MLIGTLLGIILTAAVNLAINRNEVSVKYVDIAVHILSPEPKNGDQALMEWAVKAINEYAPSALKIDGELKANLISGKTNFPLSGRVSFTEDDDTVSVKGTVK